MKIIARKINDTIFKYNANAKYSTKDLKGGYNSNTFAGIPRYSGCILRWEKDIGKNSATKRL